MINYEFRLSYRALRAVFVSLAMILALAASAAAQGVPPGEGGGGAFPGLPVGSDYVLATLVVGFLMSGVISFLNGASWAPQHKAIGAFAWCLLASVIVLFAGDQLHWVQGDYRSLFGTFLVIFVMAIGLYNFYFKPSGIAKALSEVGVK